MTSSNPQLKYIAYSRKSTESEDRQVLSLNDQKKDVEELIEKGHLNVVDSYLGDKGEKKGESQTAHKRGRPIFNHVMNQIEAGKANALIAWHVNRLARNAFDGGWIITAMDEGKLLEIKTPYKTYLNTPEDKFTLQLEFGMAKKSSDDNSVAVKRGLKTKVGMGWRPGSAPLGYLNSKNPDLKGNNDIRVDPERFHLVRRMWDLMLTGRYSPPQILKIADKEWKLKTRTSKKRPIPKSMARSHIYRIFTNPFYYGWFEYGKKELQEDGTKRKPLHPGKHPKMITEEEFDIVQKLLKDKGRPRPKRHRFAFTGLMRCGNCGAMITAEEKIKNQKNGNVHHYVYYRCTKRKDENCPEKTVELKDLSQQIDEIIKSLTISEDFKNYAIQYLHEVRTQEAKGFESIQESKQKEVLRITKNLDQLFLKYVSPENANGELISESEYLGMKQRLQGEKTQINTELEKHGRVVEEWLEFSERTFNFARYAGKWFTRGNMEEKRAVFACLGSHLVIENQKLSVELRKPFSFVFEKLPAAELELAQVRTSLEAKIPVNKNNLALVVQNCSNWRRGWDSNPRCI